MMKLRPTLFTMLLSALTVMTPAAHATDIIIDDASSTSSITMDQKLAQNAAIRNLNELFHQADDPIAGNPHGTVTLIEFFDFRCPHCARMAPVVEELIASNPEMRVVYKNFPLLGNKSVFASEAAFASIPQGKYLEFQRALMQHSKILDYDEVYSIAKSVGIDTDKLKTAMTNEKIDTYLEKNKRLGESLGIIGTPVFFIAKTDLPADASPAAIGFVAGEVDKNTLQNLINKASK